MQEGDTTKELGKHGPLDTEAQEGRDESGPMASEAADSSAQASENEPADDPEAETQRQVEAYEEKFSNPYVAAARGYIDEIIEPSKTRQRLIQSLALLENKRDSNPDKKHGNIPL